MEQKGSKSYFRLQIEDSIIYKSKIQIFNDLINMRTMRSEAIPLSDIKHLNEASLSCRVLISISWRGHNPLFPKNKLVLQYGNQSTAIIHLNSYFLLMPETCFLVNNQFSMQELKRNEITRMQSTFMED
ncbi:unnamed protein product [Paramecium octaurelia]|uniref:Uncharacterized protein n=1 Tax=Paramecium octaurelia TaxID=43137 RepID=A0A8S1YN47_PAROT|nr:unnamed protein product [Paramecium octaurelia]